jgi:hypothetical protein
MKNKNKGFVVFLLVSLVALLAIGTGVYFYLGKTQKQADLSITDFKDVVDYSTCMSYAKNIPTGFDIVFKHGSDIDEVRSFEADFQARYPRAKLTVSTEQDYLNNALAYNGGSIKTASDMATYKAGIVAQATPEISVTVPIHDLGSLQDFSSFISATLQKYPKIGFVQYAGSSPEDTLSISMVTGMQKQAESQCDYTYKQLSASQRDAENVKVADKQIQVEIESGAAISSNYYSDNASFAPGSLAQNSGICSDTGPYGLQKLMASLQKITGVAYCYASTKTYALSAPLKSDPSVGYCADSTGFFGTTTSPTAASQGYCVAPKQVSENIDSCKNEVTARDRWICVGNLVDPFPSPIESIVAPYETPVSDKLDYCKTYSGAKADYCYSSIVWAGNGVSNVEPKGIKICNMISTKNQWFKNDCISE